VPALPTGEMNDTDIKTVRGLMDYAISLEFAGDVVGKVLPRRRTRPLKLIEEIRQKTASSDTKEVQELQPLFGEALWIFGPQFESIEFTSNKGMTKVIRELFKVEDTGSHKRQDFAILPESTVGFYDRPTFDTDHNQSGVDTLVIVELKKPRVPLGQEEKAQVWGYVKELRLKGLISMRTRVTGFLLGCEIAPQGEPSTHGGRTIVRPCFTQPS